MKNKHNFSKTFKVFEQNYKEIPLEIFKKDPYKTLVSTLLSSRTKDEVTLKSSKRLFKKASSINLLNKLKIKDIEELIYPVGFYKTKAKHLKKMSKILIRDYNGKIPKTRQKLISLPGVGRKTANLVLNRAFDTPAIAVDTHVHRITNMLGWVNTKNPKKTEESLNKILPKKYWSNINRLFVSIGRQFTSKKDLINFLEKNHLIKGEG